MKMMITKPDTTKYPYEEAVTPEHFRGKLKYESQKCIGCRICVRVCPSNAIEIEKTSEKQYKAYVQLDRCLYCGQCVDSCPKKALENTKCFELASLDKDKLKVEI
jgi:formate hydrogenlyase subunit 6/NADH:ubiquinone oxidoreductase subunit I